MKISHREFLTKLGKIKSKLNSKGNRSTTGSAIFGILVVSRAIVALPEVSLGDLAHAQEAQKQQDQRMSINSSLDSSLCEENPYFFTSKDNYSLSCKLYQQKETARINRLEQEKRQEQEKIKAEVGDILAGTPMESMIEPISKQEKTTAAFLVGIALKESGLGRHAPSKNGRDCYNYWGYKGRINPTSGGYSCFETPQQAVEVVGNRINHFVEQGRDTPQKMLVWKCGASCATHSPSGVQKWVSDVSIYFNKLK